MKVLVGVLLLGMAVSAWANGTWHGAYIGKGTVTNSCDNTSKEYVSTIDWAGFDLGTYFYYGLRFADSLRIVADDVVLSRNWKAVFDSDLTSGGHTSYEDCPSRDACEGQCCDVEDSDDSAAAPQESSPSLAAVSPRVTREALPVSNSDNSSGKTYPTKTEVKLEFKNGENAHLSWIEPDEYNKTDIKLEAKVILADGCELTWQDTLVWHKKKPAEVQETLHCLAGQCRWKKLQQGE